MNHTPEGYRDLVLEHDIFTAIKQLLSWTPPPKWERSRDRYEIHVSFCSVAAAVGMRDL